MKHPDIPSLKAILRSLKNAYLSQPSRIEEEGGDVAGFGAHVDSYFADHPQMARILLNELLAIAKQNVWHEKLSAQENDRRQLSIAGFEVEPELVYCPEGSKDLQLLDGLPEFKHVYADNGATVKHLQRSWELKQVKLNEASAKSAYTYKTVVAARQRSNGNDDTLLTDIADGNHGAPDPLPILPRARR
jgi:hypothetical protein